MEPNRRQFIVASGVALAGTGAFTGAGGAETRDAPTPGTPGAFDYPTTTTDPTAPTATIYGGFDCPYTAKMVENSFSDIITEFVDTGRLTLTFRSLEYDENGDPYVSQDGVMCGQAAGGVWQEDPERFWQFFAELWTHQPGDVTTSKLEEIMRSAGVERAQYVAENLENWDPALRETADAARAAGVEYTPTIELHGDLGNRTNVIEWIEQRLEDEDGGGVESGNVEEGDDGQSTQTGQTGTDTGQDDSPNAAATGDSGDEAGGSNAATHSGDDDCGADEAGVGGASR